MSKELMKEAQYKIDEPSDVNLTPLGDEKFRSLGRINDVRFFMGNVEVTATVEVIDLPGKIFLLGTDWIREERVNIDFRNDILNIEKNGNEYDIPIRYLEEEEYEEERRGQKGGKGNLYPIKIGEPFERIGIDFVGPLERTKEGNKYILVVTDYLTKWPEARAMKEATAKNVVEFIYKEIICRHGCPRVILSDRGTHFRNEIVDGLCEKFKIKHKLSSPYHPQTNGLVERFNRTLCEELAKVIKEEDEWDRYIESVLFAYRTNKYNTTKRTPFFMVYGREVILPIDDYNQDREISEKESLLKRIYEIINLKERRNEVLDTIERSQEKQKQRHAERINEDKFEIGDKILLKDAAKEKQWSGKLSQKWKGPYYIHQVIGKGAYKLRDMDGRILKATRNIKHLKKYFDQKDLTTTVYV